MDIKKRLDEELKKVDADKDHIRQGFERRAAERRTWAVPVIEAVQSLQQEVEDRTDVVWDLEEMAAGVRLGKPGKRGYRRIQISVVAPAPDRETATYILAQTDSDGKQLAQTVFDQADQAIEVMIKAVGEHVANHPIEAGDAEGMSAGTRSKKGARDKAAKEQRRTLTIVLVIMVGLVALLAGWYFVAVMGAVPDDLVGKGVQTVGGLWEKVSEYLDLDRLF